MGCLLFRSLVPVYAALQSPAVDAGRGWPPGSASSSTSGCTWCLGTRRGLCAHAPGLPAAGCNEAPRGRWAGGQRMYCTATTCPGVVGFVLNLSSAVAMALALFTCSLGMCLLVCASRMLPRHRRCSSSLILQAALACWLQLGRRLWRLSLVVRVQQAHTMWAARQNCTQQPTILQLQGWRLLSATS